MEPRKEKTFNFFTKGFFIYLAIVIIITGIALRNSYNNSRYFAIGQDKYELVEYSEDNTSDHFLYFFTTKESPEDGGTAVSVFQKNGKYGETGRKGSESFCDHEIVVRSGADVKTYTYQAISGNEWAEYNSHHFPGFQIQMPDGRLEKYNFQTVERWQLEKSVSDEARFVLDCISAVKEHEPFRSKMILTFIIASGAIIVWFGVKIRISNVLWISDSQKRMYGDIMSGNSKRISSIADKRDHE